MMLILRRVPAQSHTSKGNEILEPIQQVRRQKVMTMFKTLEKVQRVSRKLAQTGEVHSKHGSRVSSLIRIQIEDAKAKVRALSPSALQFIGPGDRFENPTTKGGQ